MAFNSEFSPADYGYMPDVAYDAAAPTSGNEAIEHHEPTLYDVGFASLSAIASSTPLIDTHIAGILRLPARS